MTASRSIWARLLMPLTAPGEDVHRTEALVSLLQLHWFIRLRWLMVGGALALLALEQALAPEVDRPRGLILTVLATGAANVLWMLVSRGLVQRYHSPASQPQTTFRTLVVFANAQVAVDLLLLTSIIYFSGGVTNPMAIFYLFHMAISSLVLERPQAILQGVWAVLLYAAMSLSQWAGLLDTHTFLPHLPATDFATQPTYVLCAIGTVAAGVFGMLYFTLHIAHELDQRENELRESNAALQRSQQAIKELQGRRARFMQTAAHQLKSPLATIETLAGLVRDDIVPPEAVRPTCEKIAARCQEGVRQVSELLALARVEEADPARHRLEVADTVQIATDISRRYAPTAHEKGVSLNFRVPSEVNLRVRVDARDLTDCLDNLISNAVKYTPGPGEVTVAVSCAKTIEEALDAAERGQHQGACDGRPRFVGIMVRDTGIGIEPDALPAGDDGDSAGTIFEDFRRGKTALSAGVHGTGLGLSIVREVVEQTGGRIRVRSAPGAGSTFVIAFPAWQPAQTLSGGRGGAKDDAPRRAPAESEPAKS